MDKIKTPVEEQIMYKWLKHLPELERDDIFRKKIGFKWGLYHKKERNGTFTLTDTIQGINYKQRNEALTYKRSYLIKDVSLNLTKNLTQELQKKDVDLIFTFAPNYATGMPTGKATEESNKDPIFKRDALKFCIESCLERCENNAAVIIPHLGAGVNNCKLNENTCENQRLYTELIQELLREKKTLRDKNLSINVVFYRKIKS
jgi:hypothetical protein